LPSGTTVTAISAGSQDSLALLSDGTVMAWGYNADGELGDGSTSGPADCMNGTHTYPCSPTPVAVDDLADVTAVSAGVDGNLALLAGGTVMSWGNGTTVPTKVTFSPALPPGVTVTAIAEGEGDSFALLSDTIVMAWGDNSLGQLGQGNLDASYSKPVAVTRLTDATAISAGPNHTLALLGNGTVMGWGSDTDQDLGAHAGKTRCQCVDHPVKIGGLHRVLEVSAGTTHNLALLSNGEVKGWGEGSDGELGSGVASTSGRAKPIAGLGRHSSTISAGSSYSLAVS
jgi:alpha-tubulin suppressor-like RCC1 family protein